ncbi:Defensin [Quillaja saponaria]|uniref:Defensin n=1 Tax=Quillaja saponaria TaxID=32244 RepID=A0AAD7LE06_QUISA|nr:Defensin [Quillaja saponaria]
MERKPLGFLLLLLVVLTAHETMIQTEAKICNVLSDKYKGLCIGSGGCSSVCKNVEGLLNGNCNFGRCFCNKNC